MKEKSWFKRICYCILLLGCAFAGYVIYYASENGTLYTEFQEHLITKALILGIPAFLCLVIDMIYQSHEMLEAIAWKTSFGTVLFCLPVGYWLLGDQQEAVIFGLSVPGTLIYILMYAIPVGISLLVGLLDIYIGEDPFPKPDPNVIIARKAEELQKQKYETFVQPPAKEEVETDAFGRPF